MASPQLPEIPPVERLSPRCIRILGGNPGKFTLQGTNTYLLGTGRQRILVDTGEGRPAWIESLRQTLDEERAVVETIILTHWHHDHVGGVDDVRELYSDGQPPVYKFDPGPDHLPLADGQTFRVDGVTLTAMHAPGHTADHVVLVLAEEDAMLTADSVLGHGTAVFEDLAAYLASLERIRTAFRGRAYPGHGLVIEDGPDRIKGYVEHRRQREDQVLKSLADSLDADSGPGLWTAMDLVKVIYQGVPKELYPAAAGGVGQILRKLESEGRVTQQGNDRWQLRERSTL